MDALILVFVCMKMEIWPGNAAINLSGVYLTLLSEKLWFTTFALVGWFSVPFVFDTYD